MPVLRLGQRRLNQRHRHRCPPQLQRTGRQRRQRFERRQIRLALGVENPNNAHLTRHRQQMHPLSEHRLKQRPAQLRCRRQTHHGLLGLNHLPQRRCLAKQHSLARQQPRPAQRLRLQPVALHRKQSHAGRKTHRGIRHNLHPLLNRFRLPQRPRRPLQHGRLLRQRRQPARQQRRHLVPNLSDLRVSHPTRISP